MLVDKDKADEEDKEDGEDMLMMERRHLLITEEDLKLGSMGPEIFFRTSLLSKEELLQGMRYECNWSIIVTFG